MNALPEWLQWLLFVFVAGAFCYQCKRIDLEYLYWYYRLHVYVYIVAMAIAFAATAISIILVR